MATLQRRGMSIPSREREETGGQQESTQSLWVPFLDGWEGHVESRAELLCPHKGGNAGAVRWLSSREIVGSKSRMFVFSLAENCFPLGAAGSEGAAGSGVFKSRARRHPGEQFCLSQREVSQKKGREVTVPHSPEERREWGRDGVKRRKNSKKIQRQVRSCELQRRGSTCRGETESGGEMAVSGDGREVLLLLVGGGQRMRRQCSVHVGERSPPAVERIEARV